MIKVINSTVAICFVLLFSLNLGVYADDMKKNGEYELD